MPEEYLKPLFDKSWLNEINAKRKLVDRAYELKAKVSSEIWNDALRIYEAEDKYLNRMSIKQLGELVRDLERIKKD